MATTTQVWEGCAILCHDCLRKRFGYRNERVNRFVLWRFPIKLKHVWVRRIRNKHSDDRERVSRVLARLLGWLVYRGVRDVEGRVAGFRDRLRWMNVGAFRDQTMVYGGSEAHVALMDFEVDPVDGEPAHIFTR